MIKKSVIMDIWILWFYGYIGYIRDLSVNILTQNIDEVKINKNSKNIKTNSKKNYIRNKNRYF